MRAWLPWLAIGLLLGIALDAAWWAVVRYPLDSADSSEEIVIPAGTADAISSGKVFAFAPNSYKVPAGGSLRVINRDSAAHTVGSTIIPPGTTANVVALPDGELYCTIHPQGHLDIQLGTSPPAGGMVLVGGFACVAALVAGWILRTPAVVSSEVPSGT